MRTTTFIPVTSGDYKLIDIKVSGDDMTGDGDVYAQKINADGTWNDDMYFYLTEDGAGADGWFYESSATTPVGTDVVLSKGEAIFVTSDNSDLTFTVSGQVLAGKPEVAVPAGNSMIGNPTPVEVQLNLIEVVGDDMTGDGDVYAQKINADGTWEDDMYFYLTEDGAGADGWFLESSATTPVPDTITLKPGESIFVTSDNSNLTLTFPACL